MWEPPDRRGIDAKLGVALFSLLLAGPVWVFLIQTGGGPGPDRIEVLEQLDPTHDWRCVARSIEESDLPGTGGAWDIEPTDAPGYFWLTTPFFSYRVAIEGGDVIDWSWETGTPHQPMMCTR